MASLSSYINVWNTCLLILRQRGYRLWLEGRYDSEGMFNILGWMAEKNDYTFHADNPIELLGLTAIYEFKQPVGEPEDYWWSLEGPDIYSELLENAIIIEEYVDEEDEN